MLNLYQKNKIYHDKFNYYFDRSNNINVVFSFNFTQVLKDIYPQIEGKYLNLFKNDYDIKVFLYRKEQFHDFYEVVENVRKIELFPNSQFSTFFCKKRANKYDGKYKILVRISYGLNVEKYINEKLNEKDLKQVEYSNLKTTKIINEKKYSFFEMKSDTVFNQHEFVSDDIVFNKEEHIVSNLYEIYNDVITFNSLNNFFNEAETNRGAPNNAQLLTNYYLDNSTPYKLDYNFVKKSGEITNYYNLLNKIIIKQRQIRNYKEIDIIQNIFSSINTNNINKNRSKITIKQYEKLIDGLTSTACDNNLFNDLPQNTKKLNDSDLLLLSHCFNNISNLEISDFWANDITLLPVYILDVMSKYSIYYLKNIDEESMRQTWSLLNREEINNLQQGNYLCKISTNEELLYDSLLENYFILNKEAEQV